MPEKPTATDRPWFATPLANDLMVDLRPESLERKVTAIRDVAATLARLLAEKGIHHRDVKPANIFRYRGRTVIGDLGLAKRPEDPPLSDDKIVAGAHEHLPSEVFVGDGEPDWELVDVCCLASTLWCVAAGRVHPPRGQIRVDDDHSLASLFPTERNIRELATIIQKATSQTPTDRPRLGVLVAQLQGWLDGVTNDFIAEVESAEGRKVAVLRWLVRVVRTEPVFDVLMCDFPDDLETPSDVPNLTEGQLAEAFEELIEDGLVQGELHHTFGRDEPRIVSRIYPTITGIEQVDDVEAIVIQGAPILRAFRTRNQSEGIMLGSTATVELAPGLMMAPAEAFFQMRVLQAHGMLDWRELRESGPGYSMWDVHTTAAGKRFLAQLERGGDLDAA